MTIPTDHAAIESGETEDGPHGGRLPRPVGAQESHHLSGRNREGEIVEGGEGPEATGQPFEFEEAHFLRLEVAAPPMR